MSNWNKTSGLGEYQHVDCPIVKSLDLSPEDSPDNLVDVQDLGALLSCWGEPLVWECYFIEVEE